MRTRGWGDVENAPDCTRLGPPRAGDVLRKCSKHWLAEKLSDPASTAIAERFEFEKHLKNLEGIF